MPPNRPGRGRAAHPTSTSTGQLAFLLGHWTPSSSRAVKVPTAGSLTRLTIDRLVDQIDVSVVAGTLRSRAPRPSEVGHTRASLGKRRDRLGSLSRALVLNALMSSILCWH